MGFRDSIVENVMNLKKEAFLNCCFGSLTLRNTGSIEWKSTASALQVTDDFDRLASDYVASGDRFLQTMSRTNQSFNNRKQSENYSRMSNAERSLNFMQ